jgi:succinoglycan biosynthesis protein ExoL
MTTKIAYFAHDLADPAVHRRIRMLVAGGAEVTPIGFRRSSDVPASVDGNRMIELGRTADGMLARRVLSVGGTLIGLRKVAEHLRGIDVILARNLEMLVLAVRARKLYAPRATVVYECLDIHRTLLSNRLGSGMLRLLEAKLWRHVDLLLTSSPAFVHNYFIPRGFQAPIRLVENKLLMLGSGDYRINSTRRQPGPPWRLGWFGMIRCRRSLDILSSLTRAAGGALEVVIRGRPSGATFPDFGSAIADLPHVSYAGPYRNPDDLPTIYSDVHFNWTIDYYEDGQNSAWLLPNRIYEGSFYGAVPIALATVETGRWLAARGAGVVLREPAEQALADFFRRLDANIYARLADAIETLTRTDLISDRPECVALVDAMYRNSTEPTRAGAANDLACRAAERVTIRPNQGSDR